MPVSCHDCTISSKGKERKNGKMEIMEMEKSAQTLASSCLLAGTFPVEFIRPLAEQPATTALSQGSQGSI